MKRISKLLSKIFPKNSIRFVGGCVRDKLANIQSSDYDLATLLKPEHIIQILDENKIIYYDYGLSHGTVAANIFGHVVEITTLRRDVQTDGRHAKIEFSTSWIEDASRRDFTINAMYMSLDGEIYDYFNGIQDLQNRQINFIGNPSDRIQEDYLRMLRYFRFLSRYGNDNIFDDKNLCAIKHHVKSISHISHERIRKEIIGILGNRYSGSAILMMHNTLLLQNILGEYDKSFIVYCLLNNAQFSFIIFCGILLHTGYSLNDLQSILRLSRNEIRKLQAFLYYHDNCHHKEHSIEYFIANGNADYIRDLRALHCAMHNNLYIPQRHYFEHFALTPKDIISQGFSGSDIGKQYKQRYYEWLCYK